MTDLDVIKLLMAKYATDPNRSKFSQLAKTLGTYPQAVTHMFNRKRVPAGLRARVFKLANGCGAKLDFDWMVPPTLTRTLTGALGTKMGRHALELALKQQRATKRKGKANGRTRHAAKGKRNGQRQKPKGRKATARKGGRQGAQRAAV
jgi:hypothetical protein